MKCILCSLEPKDPRESKRGLHLNCAITFIQDRREKGVEADAALAKANKALSVQVQQLTLTGQDLREEKNVLQGIVDRQNVANRTTAAQSRIEPYPGPRPETLLRYSVNDRLFTSYTEASRSQGSSAQVSRLRQSLYPTELYKILALCIPDTNELSIKLDQDFSGRSMEHDGNEIFVSTRLTPPHTLLHRIAAQIYDAFDSAKGENPDKISMKDVEAYQWYATFGPDPSRAGYFLIKVPNRPLPGKDRFSLIELE